MFSLSEEIGCDRLISMKKTFPLHGIIGILLLILSEILLFKKIDPFYSFFYCFAWWSYILTIDGFIYYLKGNSLLLNRTREFFLMIPWSIFIWLIFEAANLSLENWYYINLPPSIVERWAGYAIAYGTVLPGLFETTELLETITLKPPHHPLPLPQEEKGRMRSGHPFLILLGILSLILSVVIPKYFFPLIWVGFIFLLEPFNYRYGTGSLLRDLEAGKPGKICLLLIAGLICGFLWEFWNFWARSKWVYTVPFFDEMKGFEMPFLGFLGFPPFAVQAYVMYHFISLFRFGRGWEVETCKLHSEKRTRPLTIILTTILLISFSILIFTAIDFKTVDSFYPRMKDAYWIPSDYRKELPKVGIATLEDLVLKTDEKKEREELALRLLIPKEELNHWVEKAQLVQIKGMGIENLRLLEEIGIHSVSDLSLEDPEKLYEKIGQVFQGRIPHRKAKIRIWVREAKKVWGPE